MFQALFITSESLVQGLLCPQEKNIFGIAGRALSPNSSEWHPLHSWLGHRQSFLVG